MCDYRREDLQSLQEENRKQVRERERRDAQDSSCLSGDIQSLCVSVSAPLPGTPTAWWCITSAAKIAPPVPLSSSAAAARRFTPRVLQ